MKKKTALVLLSFNEIEGTSVLVPTLIENRANLGVDEIFAVDGGSTDGTLEVYAKHGIRVVKQISRGRGEAMRLAHKDTDADHIIFFSPDGNEDWKDIPKFAPYFTEGADLVIASRMMKGAHNEEDHEFFRFRKWANNAFNLVANLLFRRSGRFVTDTINGFRGMRRGLLEELGVDALGYTVEYQMTMRSFQKRLNIVEFPTHEGARIGGETKAPSIPTGIRFLKCLGREMLLGTSATFSTQPWLWLVLAGLAIRLVWVLSYQPVPISDFEMYWGFARDFSENFFRTVAPGYSLGFPYLLAVFLKLGFTLQGILVIQALVGAAVVSSVCGFMYRHLGRGQAWASAVLLSFGPGLIFYSSILGTEIFSLALVTWGTLMFADALLSRQQEHLWKWIFAGALIGLSATLRSALTYLPLALALAALIATQLPTRPRLKVCSLFLTGWIAVVLGYCSWSLDKSGEFRISAKHGSQMFWQGTLPEAGGAYNGASLLEAEKFAHSPKERDQVYYQQGIANIKAEPARFVKLGYHKLRTTFGSLGSAMWWNFEIPAAGVTISPGLNKVYSHWLTKYQRLIHALLFLSLASGLWMFLRRRSESIFLIWLLSGASIGYLATISFITIGADRFQLPFIPMFVIFGISTPLWSAFKQRLRFPQGSPNREVNAKTASP